MPCLVLKLFQNHQVPEGRIDMQVEKDPPKAVRRNMFFRTFEINTDDRRLAPV
jgi:hypothetical protein